MEKETAWFSVGRMPNLFLLKEPYVGFPEGSYGFLGATQTPTLCSVSGIQSLSLYNTACAAFSPESSMQ